MSGTSRNVRNYLNMRSREVEARRDASEEVKSIVYINEEMVQMSLDVGTLVECEKVCKLLDIESVRVTIRAYTA